MKNTCVIKSIAVFILVAFTVSFVVPVSDIHALSQIFKSEEGTATADTHPSEVNGDTLAAEGLCSDLKNALKKEDVKSMKALLEEIQQKAFKSKESVLKEADTSIGLVSNISDIVEKQKSFKHTMEDKYKSFEKNIGEVTALLQDKKVFKQKLKASKLEEVIEKVCADFIGKPLDKTLGKTLPHSNVQIEPRVPANSTGILPAYLGSRTALTQGALSKQPVPEDLAGISETRPDEKIKQLADSLGDNPLELYDYVRNTIGFEPYFGSRKGAAGTLQQKNGNDVDQASLLISMFRYKGIPARYVRGNVEVPINKVMAWVGAESPEAAVRILAGQGIPATSIISGGSIASVRLEHVWVEANVPYEYYRGTGGKNGQKLWIPLDPSFKQVQRKSSEDLKDILGISKDEMLRLINLSSASSSEPSAYTGLDLTNLADTLESKKNLFEDHAEKNKLSEKDMEDMIGGTAIIPQKLGLLPGTLPYKTIAVLSEYAALPDSMKERISFSISGADTFGIGLGLENDFEYTAITSELYGKRITLSWIPASANDEAVIKQYGGLFKTPPYMVDLKPVLKVGGVDAAVGKPVGMGERQEFTISFSAPGFSDMEDVTNPVTAGSYYCIGLDYGTVTYDELDGIYDNLDSLSDTINAGGIYKDESMGELLNAVSKVYFAQLDVMNKMMAEQFGVRQSRFLSEGMTGYDMKVGYLFNSPVKVSEGGMFIDVDHDVHAVCSLTQDKTPEKAFMMISGVMSSYMENAVFEQMFDTPSVSTIKILQEANRLNIPIHTLNKDNASSILPKLGVGASVKSDIINAINEGKTVTIPERNIRYNEWEGAGYIVMDQNTGAAGYMISGGIAGGSFSIKRALEHFLDALIRGLPFFLLFVGLALLFPEIVGILAIIGIIFLIVFVIQMLYLIFSDLIDYGEVRAGTWELVVGESLAMLVYVLLGGLIAKYTGGKVKPNNKTKPGGTNNTKPTLKNGGKPKGNYEKPDPKDIRPIARQNEAADLLADKGYDIEMLPNKKGGNGYGVKEGSNPDYLIDGEPFDCYSPDTMNVRNIWDVVRIKTETQARRVVLNLKDYKGSMDALKQQFSQWKIDTLDELLIIDKNGDIFSLF